MLNSLIDLPFSKDLQMPSPPPRIAPQVLGTLARVTCPSFLQNMVERLLCITVPDSITRVHLPFLRRAIKHART